MATVMLKFVGLSLLFALVSGATISNITETSHFFSVYQPMGLESLPEFEFGNDEVENRNSLLESAASEHQGYFSNFEDEQIRRLRRAPEGQMLTSGENRFLIRAEFLHSLREFVPVRTKRAGDDQLNINDELLTDTQNVVGFLGESERESIDDEPNSENDFMDEFASDFPTSEEALFDTDFPDFPENELISILSAQLENVDDNNGVQFPNGEDKGSTTPLPVLNSADQNTETEEQTTTTTEKYSTMTIETPTVSYQPTSLLLCSENFNEAPCLKEIPEDSSPTNATPIPTSAETTGSAFTSNLQNNNSDLEEAESADSQNSALEKAASDTAINSPEIQLNADQTGAFNQGHHFVVKAPTSTTTQRPLLKLTKFAENLLSLFLGNP